MPRPEYYKPRKLRPVVCRICGQTGLRRQKNAFLCGSNLCRHASAALKLKEKQ
jgi:hypothetical protein